MNLIASEKLTFDNREVWLGWYEGIPAQSTLRISQVSAFCIYQGKLILVKNKRGWGIPGGHPEVDETSENTLHRELYEEACLNSKDYTERVMGYQKVEDPSNEGREGKESLQLRYIVFTEALPTFVPNDEIFDRILIDIADFAKYVSWGNSPTGKAQISTLLKEIFLEEEKK
jgi:ADP-ribose pyrophosphatase YjhB (NUDIX family)